MSRITELQNEIDDFKKAIGAENQSNESIYFMCKAVVEAQDQINKLIEERDFPGNNLIDIPIHDIDPEFEVGKIENPAEPPTSNFENILKESESIIFNRDSEKERQYGPFDESMTKAANIATNMILDVEITPIIMYKCMIALKMSRLSYNLKYDTFLDAVGYTAALQDYVKKHGNDE